MNVRIFQEKSEKNKKNRRGHTPPAVIFSKLDLTTIFVFVFCGRRIPVSTPYDTHVILTQNLQGSLLFFCFLSSFLFHLTFLLNFVFYFLHPAEGKLHLCTYSILKILPPAAFTPGQPFDGLPLIVVQTICLYYGIKMI